MILCATVMLAAFMAGLNLGFALRRRETRQAFEIVANQSALIEKLLEHVPGEATLNLRGWAQ